MTRGLHGPRQADTDKTRQARVPRKLCVMLKVESDHMPEEARRQHYEFFISRAGADAAVAKEVADVLRQAGHSVQYQDEDIPFGANFIERMSALVENCQNLVIILSPAYLNSPYCREEWTNFLADLFADTERRRVIVLPQTTVSPLEFYVLEFLEPFSISGTRRNAELPFLRPPQGRQARQN